MKRTIGFYVFVVGVALLVGLWSNANTPQRSYGKHVEASSGQVTTGSAATVTLAQVSFDCIFTNDDTTATNTYSLKFNGGTAAFLMRGGDSLNVTDFPITSFTHTAVTNTPTMRWVCFEQ